MAKKQTNYQLELLTKDKVNIAVIGMMVIAVCAASVLLGTSMAALGIMSAPSFKIAVKSVQPEPNYLVSFETPTCYTEQFIFLPSSEIGSKYTWASDLVNYIPKLQVVSKRNDAGGYDDYVVGQSFTDYMLEADTGYKFAINRCSAEQGLYLPGEQLGYEILNINWVYGESPTQNQFLLPSVWQGMKAQDLCNSIGMNVSKISGFGANTDMTTLLNYECGTNIGNFKIALSKAVTAHRQVSSHPWYNSGFFYQITNNQTTKTAANISGNNVVWSEEDNKGYLYYLGADGLPFTGDANEGLKIIPGVNSLDSKPIIDGNKIVYTKVIAGDHQIYLYHLGDDGIFGTGDNKEGNYFVYANDWPSQDVEQIDIGGNKILIKNNPLGLWLVDLGPDGIPGTGDRGEGKYQMETGYISVNSGGSINGNRVVYARASSVYMYHLGSDGMYGTMDINEGLYEVINNNNSTYHPIISGSKIVYNMSTYDIPSDEIFKYISMYELGADGIPGTNDEYEGVYQIVDADDSASWPDISGNLIVWNRSSEERYVYNLGADGIHNTGDDVYEYLISDSTAGKGLWPEISGNKIVYTHGDTRNENHDVYLYIYNTTEGIGPKCTEFQTRLDLAWHTGCGDSGYDPVIDISGPDEVPDGYIDHKDLFDFVFYAEDEQWCDNQLNSTFDFCAPPADYPVTLLKTPTSSMNAEDLLQGLSQYQCNKTIRYNTSTGLYETHLIDLPMNNYSIVVGEGYLVSCKHKPDLNILPGKAIRSEITINLKNGYNLIGVPYLRKSMTSDELLLRDDIDSVSVWDASIEDWNDNMSFVIKSGTAFIIKVNTNTTF